MDDGSQRPRQRAVVVATSSVKVSVILQAPVGDSIRFSVPQSEHRGGLRSLGRRPGAEHRVEVVSNAQRPGEDRVGLGGVGARKAS